MQSQPTQSPKLQNNTNKQMQDAQIAKQQTAKAYAFASLIYMCYMAWLFSRESSSFYIIIDRIVTIYPCW